MTIRAEYEGLALSTLDARRGGDEFETIVRQHTQELAAMRAMSYDLQRKHEADKRTLSEDLRRLQEENARLQHQLRARADDGPPRSALATPTPGGRPVLPSLSSHVPESTGAGWDRTPDGGKIRREGDDGRGAKDRGPTLARPLSRPSSTQPILPPSHSLSSSQNRPPRVNSPLQQVSQPHPPHPDPPARDEPPFDPATSVSSELRKEGSDWLTMFNPNVKRQLDVGLVHTLVHDSVVCCVRFSPDGRTLATGCNRNTTLYDTKTGAKISVLADDSTSPSADNYIRVAAFSPDGKLLATGSEDRIIRIWNLSQKRIWKVFQGHRSEIYSLAFSPDGRRLASGSGDKTLRMWDMDSGACVYTLALEADSAPADAPDAGVTSVAISPDGRFLAASSLDTFVRIWDAETGRLLDTLRGHKDSVYSVAFDPKGAMLVSGSLDKTLMMWDVVELRKAVDRREPTEGRAGCLTVLQGHKDFVLSVDTSPDGQWIVSGSKDRGIQFWDTKTAKAQFMLQGHKNSVISVAVSAAMSGGGGLVATGSGDYTARIWSYERI